MATEPQAPPRQSEAEWALVGALMLDQRQVPEVMDTLRAEDFYNEHQAEVYRTCVRMHREGAQIDAVTVAADLDRRQKLAWLGGRSQLALYQESCTTPTLAVQYAREVADAAVRRELIEAAGWIRGAALDGTLDSDAAVAASVNRLREVADRRVRTDMVLLGDELRGFMGELAEAQETGAVDAAKAGLRLGWPDLDEVVPAGLKPGALTLVAGRPSMGKTALATEIALNVAGLGVAVAFFSLEMSRRELAVRMLSSRSGVDLAKLNRLEVGPEEHMRAISACGPLAEHPVWIDDYPMLDDVGLHARASRVRSRRDVGLVVVDYVQLMAGRGRFDGRVEEVTRISRGLKLMARDLDVPVLAVSQLSRGPENREGDKRPRLSDLRDSGSLEQDADVVLAVYRPCYYKSSDRPGEADVIVLKQRNGPRGKSAALAFREPTARFVSLERRHGAEEDARDPA